MGEESQNGVPLPTVNPLSFAFRYQPLRFSGIGYENSNPGDQVSRGVFESCVETSPDYVRSGRPGSDRKPDDTCSCDEPHRDVRNFHLTIIHACCSRRSSGN
jgi:hypothetical protein